MQLPIRVNKNPTTAYDLAETKGSRADRERSFLSGGGRLSGTHSRGSKPSDGWTSSRTGSSRPTPQTMSTFLEGS